MVESVPRYESCRRDGHSREANGLGEALYARRSPAIADQEIWPVVKIKVTSPPSTGGPGKIQALNFVVDSPAGKGWKAGTVNSLLPLQQLDVGTRFISGGEREFHRLSVGAGKSI